MHKTEELISLLLELKLDLHRMEQNIRELVDLSNDLSLKIDGEKNNWDHEKIVISGTLIFDGMKEETKMDYERIRKERRFKILSFDYEEILELLMVPSDHYMRIKRIALPDGFYADSVHFDPSNRSFDFIIGCENLPPIPEFGRIPYCGEEIKYTVIELNQGKDFSFIDKNCGIQE